MKEFLEKYSLKELVECGICVFSIMVIVAIAVFTTIDTSNLKEREIAAYESYVLSGVDFYKQSLQLQQERNEILKNFTINFN